MKSFDLLSFDAQCLLQSPVKVSNSIRMMFVIEPPASTAHTLLVIIDNS